MGYYFIYTTGPEPGKPCLYHQPGFREGRESEGRKPQQFLKSFGQSLDNFGLSHAVSLGQFPLTKGQCGLEREDTLHPMMCLLSQVSPKTSHSWELPGIRSWEPECCPELRQLNVIQPQCRSLLLFELALGLSSLFQKHPGDIHLLSLPLFICPAGKKCHRNIYKQTRMFSYLLDVIKGEGCSYFTLPGLFCKKIMQESI